MYGKELVSESDLDLRLMLDSIESSLELQAVLPEAEPPVQRVQVQLAEASPHHLLLEVPPHMPDPLALPVAENLQRSEHSALL